MKNLHGILDVLKVNAAAFLVVVITQTATAFTYHDTDLLLVFRQDGANDVEFDLGSVSNYLGHAPGTILPVTTWNLNVVLSNYNNSLSGVKVLLIAATGNADPLRRVWVSDASLSASRTDIPGSRFSSLRSKVDAIGNTPQIITVTNSDESYVVSPADPSSFTYLASSTGSGTDASSIAGFTQFTVENAAPTVLRFFELKPSASPQPPAVQLGDFCLTSSGSLYFVAGNPPPPPAPPHLTITRNGNVNSITFATDIGGYYVLGYSSLITLGKTSWPTLPTFVVGDGTTQVITDTTANPLRFYTVRGKR